MPIKLIISKLGPKLKDWQQLLERLPPQHRRLVWLLLGGLALVLVYLVLVSPLLNLTAGWNDELARRRQILARYRVLTASKAKVAKANQDVKAALAAAEGQFLGGANAAVAASDLQEIIKSLARDHGVQLTSTKIMTTREAGPYLEVPVQIQFTSSISQAQEILYYLEHHKKLLFIPEVEINAPRAFRGDRGGSILQINLVVSGIIRKGTIS